MNELAKPFRDLSRVKSGPYINQEWVDKTNAKPTKVALWVVKGKLEVCTLYWEGDDGGVWADENAFSVCGIILDLPK